MALVKPSQYVRWNPSQSNVTQPPDTLRARGWQQNEAPVAQHMNWALWLSDQWTQYFDQSLTNAVMTTTLDTTMRLMGGGTLSYAVSTGALSWSQPLFLSIPSVADADNQIPAGSVVVGNGQVAYVQANYPFTALGDVTSGTATVQNVGYTAGIAAGQAVTGTGMASGTTVVSVSGTTVTLSQNATATAQQTPLTYAGTGALSVQVANVASLVPSANTVILGRATATALYLGVNSGQIILRDGEQRRLLEAGFHDVRYLTVGQGFSIPARTAVYISTAANNGITGSIYPTDASAANGAQRSTCIGFTTTSATSATVASVMTGGVLGGFTGLTTGATYYLDPANVGQITLTRPTGGNYVVTVGLALDANTLYVRVPSALGAPTLDPSYNSVTVQPVTGDTNTVQLLVKDASGNSKLTADASGNVTSVATVTANSLVSAAGIKTTLAPAYLNFSVGANTTPGANGNSPIALAEAGLGQVYNTKSPFKGSIVGVSIIYRYTATQGTAPVLTFNLTVSGNNNSNWNTNTTAGTAGNTDYAFSNSQAKGVQPFAINDNIQGNFSSATSFTAACNFVARVTIWVEVSS